MIFAGLAFTSWQIGYHSVSDSYVALSINEINHKKAIVTYYKTVKKLPADKKIYYSKKPFKNAKIIRKGQQITVKFY